MLSSSSRLLHQRLAVSAPTVLRPASVARLAPTAVFHTCVGRPRPACPAAVARKDAAAAPATAAAKSKSGGSRHWAIERGLAVGSLVLLPAAVFIPSAPVDYAMGVIFPLHAYYGLESAVIDYLPKRKFGALYHVALNSVRLLTLLTMYGFYELNSNDIGITNAVKALWSI